MLSVQPSLEAIENPAGQSSQRATLSGFENELDEAATERQSEAKDYFEVGERDFGRHHYRDAANNYQKSIDALPTMTAYLNLGNSLYSVSNYESTEKAYIAGLQIARKKRNKEFEGAFVGNIGTVYADQGRLKEALRSYQAALEILKQIGNPLGQANALTGIGIVYSEQGKEHEAVETLDQACTIFLGVGARIQGLSVVERRLSDLRAKNATSW